MGKKFERRRLRVYVAGPISSDVFEGVARGSATGRQLFVDGLAPFVPHFDAFWFLPDGNWPAYLEYDLEYVSTCDAVYRLTGYSPGADKECAVAEALDIPVFYQEHDDIGPHGRVNPNTPLGYQGLLNYADSKRLRGKRMVNA